METATRTYAIQHIRIGIETELPTQFIDLTSRVEAFLARTGIEAGLLTVQSLHTTAAILVNEHEPLLLADLTAMLERMAPHDGMYRHDNLSLRSSNCVLGERPNGHAHCRALLLPTSVCLNVAGGRMQLGRWQRLFLVEFDGPRPRQVSLSLVGGAER